MKLSEIDLTGILERAVKGIATNQDYSDGTAKAAAVGGNRQQTTRSYNIANIPGGLGISYRVKANPTTGIQELEHIKPVVITRSEKVIERYPNLAKLEKIGYKRIPQLNEKGEKIGEDLIPNILNPHEWEHEELFSDREIVTRLCNKT
jgi:hypothetical protein